MAVIILSIGLMVFFSHFLSLQFKKTNIPDVLVLMAIGLTLGPVMGWISPDDFGKAGSVIATIALVVILFESGTSINLEVMGRALNITSKIAIGSFILTAGIVTWLAILFLELTLLPALLLGVILAGTSSAVVIPMVSSLKLGEKPATVLVLESALTDVLCIVGVFALLQVITQGDVDAGKLIGGVLAALIFAAAIGFLGGIGWLFVLGKVRDFPNTISSTLAYAFIIYGVCEFLGFSGAIASLSLGITISNFKEMGLGRFHFLNKNIVSLTSFDLAFYGEAVFLLKTYFFVYLGISIHFSSPVLLAVAGGMMFLVFLMRIILARFIYKSPEFTLRDTAITTMLAPKGLAAAVLATLPMQYGVVGGELIRDTTYMVVLISISLTAILIIIYPNKLIQKFYSAMLNKPVHVVEKENTPTVV